MTKRFFQRLSLTPNQWAVAFFAALILVEILLVLGTGFQNRSDFGVALDVATGTRSPFDTRGGIAVALAAFSWLLLPAVIGALAAFVFSRIVENRSLTPEQGDALVAKARAEFEKVVVEHLAGTKTEATSGN